jgi:hypothetical protein
MHSVAFVGFTIVGILGNHCVQSFKDKLDISSPPSRQRTNSNNMSVSKLFQNGKKPNILIIITDQERKIQHWPESFSKDNLPAMERLKRHGLDFNHHYTNACMCSPSRSTLLTSQYPVKTGVTR